jgi:hypothetical protein
MDCGDGGAMRASEYRPFENTTSHARSLFCGRPGRTLQLKDGAQNLLDGLHRTRPGCGFCVADLVGPGGDDSDRFYILVGGLPERLVCLNGFAW